MKLRPLKNFVPRKINKKTIFWTVAAPMTSRKKATHEYVF